MPLDHYVPQVHLKNFYSPSLGERMYGIRKNDMHMFQCKSNDVCRTKDGSTNVYIEDERAIEEFLKTIEPKYNKAVQRLRDDKIDTECIYTISGFVAFVASCSPAAMRLRSDPLRKTLDTTIRILDGQGKIPKAPTVLGGKTATELLDEGEIEHVVDPKYPQALGISNIIEHTAMFGNFNWNVMINEEPSSPFFTSDYPVAIEKSGDPRFLNRVVPLAPDIAIRIRPDINIDRAKADLSFSQFSYRRVCLGHSQIRKINQLIVQCAETLVFYRDEFPWIGKFVFKNRQFRIESQTKAFQTAGGVMNLSTQRIALVSEHHA